MKSQIHYEIKIGNDVDVEIPYNCICIDKYQSFINEMEIDIVIDQLYEKLGQLLYPLYLNLNKDGSIHSIANKKEIKGR